MGGTIIPICEIVCVSNKKMNPSNTLIFIYFFEIFSHIFEKHFET
jgi:hypothetical protein